MKARFPSLTTGEELQGKDCSLGCPKMLDSFDKFSDSCVKMKILTTDKHPEFSDHLQLILSLK